MNKRLIITTALFIGALLLESSAPFTYNTVGPEYVFACLIGCSFFAGVRASALFGLIFGLAADFLSGFGFGLRGIAFMLIGYSVAFIITNYISPNLFCMLIACVVGLFLYEALLFALFSLSAHTTYSEALRFILLPKLMMTVPVGILFYPFFKLAGEKRK